MTATTSLEAELQRVSRAYQCDRARRDELIRRALAAGIPQVRIAQLSGLTKGRVSQLAAERKP